MVLGLNHLAASKGQPEDYSNVNGLFPPAPGSRRGSRQGSEGHSGVSSPGVANLTSAYDVSLIVRSANPVADAHDPDVSSKTLPAHHVPSFVSIASRAIQRTGQSSKKQRRQRAKAKAKRAAEAISTTVSRTSKAHDSRITHSAADQEDSKTTLPLLSFQNPDEWNSFHQPNLLGVWKGLRWGLPEDYDEGEKGSIKGRQTIHAQRENQRTEQKLGKNWADVEVLKPDWGWPDADRQTWLEGPNVEKDRADGIASSAKGEEQSPYGQRREWQDPKRDEPQDHARVTWLGHATMLLQLPPIADPATTEDPRIEEQEGRTEGGVCESPESFKRAQRIVGMVQDSREPSPSKSIVVAKGKLKDGANGDGKDVEDASSSKGQERQDWKRSKSRPASQDVPRSKSSDNRSAPVVDNVRDRSFNIIFDPIFSKRCSPSQTVGPIRFTDPPCQAEDLPPIDVILISHDHYDHADVDSLKRILKQRGDAVHVFVGLGNKDWLCSSVGFKKAQVSELDWWDEAILTASGPLATQKTPPQAAVRIICTPAQHGSGRGPGGKDQTLWCSWMIESIAPLQVSPNSNESKNPEAIKDEVRDAPPPPQSRWRVFFAGDTGLRRHAEKPTNRKAPICPAFPRVAEKYGSPDLFLLPISIGSSLSYLRSKDPFPRRYSPFPRVSEALTSCIHMDAEDACVSMKVDRPAPIFAPD